jgi:hypothetical protein
MSNHKYLFLAVVIGYIAGHLLASIVLAILLATL